MGLLHGLAVLFFLLTTKGTKRTKTMNVEKRSNELSQEIIAAAIEVHEELGPGLLESAYQASLAYELTLREIPFKAEVALPVTYKDQEIDTAYRIDFLVDDLVIVELKSVSELASIHQAQLLTYLQLSGHWLGLLINFNTKLLKQGIKRLVQGIPIQST